MQLQPSDKCAAEGNALSLSIAGAAVVLLPCAAVVSVWRGVQHAGLDGYVKTQAH